MSALLKDYHPYVKDPNTGMVFPNTETFRQPNFIGCFTTTGVTDLNELTEIEKQKLFPNGVPDRIKTENEVAVARASEPQLAPGIELEKGVVINNLERLYAAGAITREYLLTLAGGVEQEKFVTLQAQVNAVIKQVDADEEKVKAEAEAKAKAEAEAAKKAEAEAAAKAEAEAAKLAAEFSLNEKETTKKTKK